MHASDICSVPSLNESHLTQDSASTPCPFCKACVHLESPEIPLLKPQSMHTVPNQAAAKPNVRSTRRSVRQQVPSPLLVDLERAAVHAQRPQPQCLRRTQS